MDRIQLMWSICLSVIEQSVFFDESAESLTSEHTRNVI
jgi:hypothetical protein